MEAYMNSKDDYVGGPKSEHSSAQKGSPEKGHEILSQKKLE
jgi:hypothetical protein